MNSIDCENSDSVNSVSSVNSVKCGATSISDGIFFLQIVYQLMTKIIMFKMTMAKMFATRPPQTVPTWWQGIQVPTFNCLPKTSSSSPPIPVSSIKGWVHRRKNIEIFTIWGVNHDKIKQRKKGQCHGEGGVWRMSQILRCFLF